MSETTTRVRIGYVDRQTGDPTEPGDEQAEFHAAPEIGRLFSGGLGAGKTVAGATEAAKVAVMNRGTDGLIVAPFYSTLGAVVLEAFKKALPPQWRIEDKRDPLVGRYLLMPWGSRVFYRTAENAASIEGLSTVGWAWGDEARYWSRDAFEKFIGRVRAPCQDGRPPRWWLTTTPTMGWLHEEFCSDRPERRLVIARTASNRHLPPSYLEDLKRSYSPRLLRALAEGEFVLLTGAVYGEEYDPAVHVIPWKYDPNLRTWAAWDFGYRWPHVTLAQEVPPRYTAQRPSGRQLPAGSIVWFREFIRENVPTSHLAREVALAGIKIDAIACDPAGDSTQTATGLTDLDALRQTPGLERATVRFTSDPRWRHIPTGIDIVRGRLKPATGEPPTMYFAEDLKASRNPRALLNAFASYAYPESKSGRQLSDTPKKDGVTDHANDCVRYLCTNLHLASGSKITQVPVR